MQSTVGTLAGVDSASQSETTEHVTPEWAIYFLVPLRSLSQDTDQHLILFPYYSSGQEV